MEEIRIRLRHGDVLLGDGAWGTMLMQRGLRAGEPPDMACISQPGAIEEIAALYLESGAEIVTTNSFGASPLKLQMFGLAGRTEEINRKSVEAARRAVGTRAYVSASVGPTGRLLKPYGDVEAGEVQAGFERQVRALAEAGADLICVETMTDLAEAVLAVRAARAVAPAAPVMATMTFDATPRGFHTVMGVTVEQAAAGLEEAGADILGSNCGNGIETMIEIAREFRRRSRLPVAIRSNAGLPVLREGVLAYPESPGFMAERVPQLLAAGVQIIGGCCGTTPAHIAALRKTIDSSRQ